MFPRQIRMLDAFEVGLITNIKRERRYNRCAGNGEIGVRVQTSGNPDPTGNEGATNGDLRTYIRQGNFKAALKGTSEEEKVIAELEDIVKKAHVVELSNKDNFTENYVEAMNF